MPKGVRGRLTCSESGCERPVNSFGLCVNHYHRARRDGTLVKPRRDKRSHPLYTIWYERKARGSLCAEWSADFWVFIAAIGERPGPTYLLRPKRYDKPYGPDNWEWLDALRRQPGETRAEFFARKWQARKERVEPNWGTRRNFKRKYGITPEDYDRMHAQQGGTCAICREPETRIDGRTHAPTQLSVDHCHKSGAVRGLLCRRCNTALGLVRDCPKVLRTMIAYVDTVL